MAAFVYQPDSDDAWIEECGTAEEKEQLRARRALTGNRDDDLFAFLERNFDYRDFDTIYADVLAFATLYRERLYICQTPRDFYWTGYDEDEHAIVCVGWQFE